MDIKTEFLLLGQPIPDWIADIDKHAFGLAMIGVVAVILLRKLIAHGIISLNVRVLG